MESEELKVWSLSFGELDFAQGYRRAMRAGLALQLVHSRTYRYFPRALEDIADDRILYVEEQLGSNVHLYDPQSDAARRHRLDVLRHLGFRWANGGASGGRSLVLRKRFSELVYKSCSRGGFGVANEIQCDWVCSET